MKKSYLLLISITVLTIFLCGFYYLKKNNNQPAFEIWLGYNSKQKLELRPISVEKSTIHKLEEILLNGKEIEDRNMQLGDYDIQLTFRIPEDKDHFYSSMVYFTNKGAIVKMTSILEFRSIDRTNAKLLKEIIDYKEY